MEWLYYIYYAIIEFKNGLLSVLSYIWSIFDTLWYGLTTLLSGVFDVISSIFSSGIF